MTPNIRLNIHNSQVYIYNVPNSDDNSNNENIVRNPQVPSRINQSNENSAQTTEPVLNRDNPSIPSPFRLSPTHVFLTPTSLQNETNRRLNLSQTISNLERTTRNWLDILNQNPEPENNQNNENNENTGNTNTNLNDSSGNTNNSLNDLTSLVQQAFHHLPVEQFHIQITDRNTETSQETPVSRLFSGSSLMLVPTEDVGSEERRCAICQNVYNESDIVRRLNSCEHFFHAACVEEWFSNHNNCPICRQDL
tara:strand:- start:3398 stop:4150 length:753 start_codon:yes stop_codon:yes gene_type:complete